MTYEITQELNNCILLCEKLESLFSQDADTLQECLSGEVYRQYTEGLWNIHAEILQLKRQIYMLHDEYKLLMF